MTEFLLGAGIGLGAGLIPGPLHTLVMVTAIKRGFRSGAMVALAPPLADVPVVAVALLVVGSLSNGIVRWLSLAGGLFVLWLGIDTIRTARHDDAAEGPSGSDLLRGVVTNLLSPHPWLFWLTVGAPILVTAWSDNPARALAFLGGFYGLLVGTKIAVAYVASHGRRLQGTPWYARLLGAGGVLLLVMGSLLIRDAIVG